MLGLGQLVLVVHGQLGVTHAAREAARALAVDPSLSHDELERHVGYQLEVSTDRMSAGLQSPVLRVIVSHKIQPISPLFRPILGDYQVHAEARIALE